MGFSCKYLQTFVVSLLCFHLVAAQSFIPTILQDSRDLPKTDGTFGFLYRTEDGIAHAAKGDPDGVIHGRYSYTDPTGLKVNFNYNAGSRVTPGYNYNDAPPSRQYEQPQRKQYVEPAQPVYQEAPAEYKEEPQYVEPEPQYVPRTRPPTRSNRRPQQYSAQYSESVENYQRRRPTHSRQNNEIY